MPRPERDALEDTLHLPGLRWVPYDVGPADEQVGRDAGSTTLRGAALEQLLAKRDTIAEANEQASEVRRELVREAAQRAGRPSDARGDIERPAMRRQR